MKAILNDSFSLLYIDDESEVVIDLEEIDTDDLDTFNKGDKVEILRVVDDSTYENNKAYVILNIRNNASITIHGGVLDFINE